MCPSRNLSENSKVAERIKYITLLRGINVGGHHKVPMEELKKAIKELGYDNCITLLNSGNVIFDATNPSEENIEQLLAEHLEKTFGFPIPVLVRNSENFEEIVENNPFGKVEVTKDTRLYLTFLKNSPSLSIDLPWISEDQSFKILEIRNRTIYSTLDLSVTKTPKGMEVLEKMFGKEVTTRNLNTMIRLKNKL